MWFRLLNPTLCAYSSVTCNSGNRIHSHCSSNSADFLLLNLNQFPLCTLRQEKWASPQTWQVAFAAPLSPLSPHQAERESLTGRHGCQTGSESTAEQAQCNQRWCGVITKVFTRRCPTEIPSHILGRVRLRSTHKNREISLNAHTNPQTR